MRVKKLAITVVALFGLLHLVSCSGAQRAIIGKWQEGVSSETLEFSNDGTIKIASPNGKSVQGKYTFVENDRIKIELEAPENKQTIEAKVKISGNEMIFTLLPDNRAMSLRRVN